MKNNTLLYAGAAVAALLLIKRKPVSGVGATYGYPSTSEEIRYLRRRGYIIDQSMSGYWRLFKKRRDGTTETIIDDPAESDYYDYDMAVDLFYSYVSGDSF